MTIDQKLWNFYLTQDHIMGLSCNKYEKQVIEWLNMIVSQDPTVLSVIVKSKDMIAKCIRCPHLQEWCESTAEFVRFLDTKTELLEVLK
jgi:hypothetical protein